jgi:hypothetical protein
MILSLSKTPTWVLFAVSILPVVMIYNDAAVWALSNILIFSFLSLWLYSITTQLLNRQIFASAFNRTKFIVILASSLLYSVGLSIYFSITSNNYEEPPWIFLIIIPGNIFLAYAYFFILNFTAKLIATIESKKIITFDKYASYFFCLLFFPIGIWWMNPKIKVLIKKN